MFLAVLIASLYGHTFSKFYPPVNLILDTLIVCDYYHGPAFTVQGFEDVHDYNGIFSVKGACGFISQDQRAKAELKTNTAYMYS